MSHPDAEGPQISADLIRPLRSVVFSPDGVNIATGDDDGEVSVWHVATKKKLCALVGHHGSVRTVEWPRDGLVLSGGEDGFICLWDAATGQNLDRVWGHDGGVWSISASPDGTRFASGGADRKSKLWKLAPGLTMECMHDRDHEGEIRSVAWSPATPNSSTNQILVCDDRAIRRWTVGEDEDHSFVVIGRGGLTGVDPGHNEETPFGNVDGGVSAVAWSPTGEEFASGGHNGEVCIWNVNEGYGHRPLEGLEYGRVESLAWEWDGSTVISGHEDGRAIVWDSEESQSRAPFEGDDGRVRAVACSPTEILAVAVGDHGLRLWGKATHPDLADADGEDQYDPSASGVPAEVGFGPVPIWKVQASEAVPRRPSWNRQIHDHPISIDGDRLGRGYIAGFIAGQLGGFHDQDKSASYSVQLVGQWGVGKTSVVNMVVEHLAWLSVSTSTAGDTERAPQRWVLPPVGKYFDAWGEGKVGPTWWSVLNWLRQTACDDYLRRPWRQHKGLLAWLSMAAMAVVATVTVAGTQVVGSRWLVVALAAITGGGAGWVIARFGQQIGFWGADYQRRLRRSGFAVPVALVVVTLVFVAAFVWWRVDRSRDLEGTDDVVGLVASVFGVVILLWGVGTAISHTLTWRTPTGARRFQRTDDNPLDDVANHARWLRSQCSGPILFVIDDIDRCDATYVVELLEAIQTILRRTGELRCGRRDVQPIYVLVCGDERWLNAAFESAYPEFRASVETPGRTIGDLFLAKLFQLRYTVLPPAPNALKAFYEGRHGGASESPLRPEYQAKIPTSSQHGRSTGTDRDVGSDADLAVAVDRGAGSPTTTPSGGARLSEEPNDTPVDGGRRSIAIGRATATTTTVDLSPELLPYLGMIEANPRTVVRFANAYTLRRYTLGSVSPDVIARWSALDERWPDVARRLTETPDLLEEWQASKLAPDDPHATVFCDHAFSQVARDTNDDLVLDGNAIRMVTTQTEGFNVEPD